jgi:hypothetical protein
MSEMLRTVHEPCRNPRCVDGTLTERKDAEHD